jgi:MoxR-like ATPase
MPSFEAGGAKLVHLDDVHTEMYQVDHRELLERGHSQYEDLLVRKKERASIEFDAVTEYVLLEGKPGSGKTTLVKKLALDWARGLWPRVCAHAPLRAARGLVPGPHARPA